MLTNRGRSVLGVQVELAVSVDKQGPECLGGAGGAVSVDQQVQVCPGAAVKAVSKQYEVPAGPAVPVSLINGDPHRGQQSLRCITRSSVGDIKQSFRDIEQSLRDIK